MLSQLYLNLNSCYVFRLSWSCPVHAHARKTHFSYAADANNHVFPSQIIGVSWIYNLKEDLKCISILCFTYFYFFYNSCWIATILHFLVHSVSVSLTSWARDIWLLCIVSGASDIGSCHSHLKTKPQYILFKIYKYPPCNTDYKTICLLVSFIISGG